MAQVQPSNPFENPQAAGAQQGTHAEISQHLRRRSMSVGSSIEQAARAVASRRGGGSYGGDSGELRSRTGRIGSQDGSAGSAERHAGCRLRSLPGARDPGRTHELVRHHSRRGAASAAEEGQGCHRVCHSPRTGRVAGMQLVRAVRRHTTGPRGLGRHHRVGSVRAAAQRSSTDPTWRCASASTTTPARAIWSRAISNCHQLVSTFCQLSSSASAFSSGDAPFYAAAYVRPSTGPREDANLAVAR